MIFVTVGTSTQPFDRLVAGAARLAERERVVVQFGASAIRPPGAECVAFLDYAEMLDHMREARAVVTHAGVGSIMAALSVGKRPCVVPRRRDLGEAVDDHQQELATRLEKAGLVALVADPTALPEALSASQPAPPGENGRPNALAEDLRAYLESAGRR